MNFGGRLFIVIGSILFFNGSASAQQPDSAGLVKDSLAVTYFFDVPGQIIQDRIWPLDTNLTGFEKYDLIHCTGEGYATLGNTGSPSKPLEYKALFTAGPDPGFHYADPYLIRPDNIRYYVPGEPFTCIFYVMGAKKEQVLRVSHSQNLKKNLNLGADYALINAPGFYLHQKTDYSNVDVYLRYHTSNRRYYLISNYIHNRIIIRENGGITADSLFEQNAESDRKRIPVFLETAENHYRESGVYLSQAFRLDRPAKRDRDSTGKAHKALWFRAGTVGHTFRLSNISRVFLDSDPKPEFYDLFFNQMVPLHQDSTATYDSIHYFKVENRVFWTNALPVTGSRQALTLRLGLKQLYCAEDDGTGKKTWSQLTWEGELGTSLFRHLRLSVNGDITGSGYNQGDAHLSAWIGWRWGQTSGKAGRIFAEGSVWKQEPDLFFASYHGNHFAWETDFQKEIVYHSKLGLEWGNLSAAAEYYRLDRHVYLDLLAMPRQLGTAVGIFRATLQKTFNAGHFELHNKWVYQNTGGGTVVRMPEFIAVHSLLFNLDLFRKALVTQIGIDLNYSTAYYADAYMPDLGQFFMQNAKKTGDYPYLDLFLNLKIRQARLFLKYQHFNSALSGYRYFMVPHYPQPDGAFKFGVLWIFNN